MILHIFEKTKRRILNWKTPHPNMYYKRLLFQMEWRNISKSDGFSSVKAKAHRVKTPQYKIKKKLKRKKNSHFAVFHTVELIVRI